MFSVTHQELHGLSHAQEDQGELDKFSKTLDNKFLLSSEQKNILQQLTRPHEKTLYLLNWCWPDTHKLCIPDNYDTYIFFQYREPVDWPWFEIFSQQHKNQKIILLAPVNHPVNKIHDNFFLVEYQHWHYRVARALIDYESDYRLVWPRPSRVSSLSSKPSFFKTLITAHLHKHYFGRGDLLLGWNGNPRKEICGSMTSLNLKLNRPKLDVLCDYYYSNLKHISLQDGLPGLGHYELANWQDTRAYQDSAINFTNETYSPGRQHDRTYPGPTFTEKTRKAIMAGCAIVPVGMPGSYTQLQRFGFEFRYPWSFDFDQILGDLDRIEKLLDVIDEIMSYDLEWLQQQLKDSTEYNYNYIRSTDFIQHIQVLNQQAVDKYLSSN
jgi:hypothetical protein